MPAPVNATRRVEDDTQLRVRAIRSGTSSVYTRPARLMVRDTMADMERRLGKERFLRANRSALVRIDEIKEVRPSAHGDYTLVLRKGAELPLSRSLRGKLDTLFGG